MNKETVIKNYLDKRLADPCSHLDEISSMKITLASNTAKNQINRKHILLGNRNGPVSELESKPIGDKRTVQLWNMMFSREFQVANVAQIKDTAAKYIDWVNDNYPHGENASEKVLILFITAFSSSSMVGVQNPSKSKRSLESMIRTVESHAYPEKYNRQWMWKHIRNMAPNHNLDGDVMKVEYGDVCMRSKKSSTSSDYKGSFRKFVLDHTENEILIDLYGKRIPLLIYMGTRSDRRGKYRLICSFDGRIRVIDFMINHGSYSLCEKGGKLYEFTTEGMNGSEMWIEMAKMSERKNGYVMVCIDYTGYDTQIGIEDYVRISEIINSYRIKSSESFRMMFQYYKEWMLQIKPLVTKNNEGGYDVIIANYKTLASGLHGTHSFENIIGIATMKEAKERGCDISYFKSNGDDQNTMVHRSSLQLFMKFLKDNFNISEGKSLVGHKLTVWGKLWFAEDLHPAWEIGTFRSLWERESGSSDEVEESKFASNYNKLLQVSITLMRLGKSRNEIMSFISILSKDVKPEIDLDKIPKNLETVNQIKSGKRVDDRDPKGLISQKSYLEGLTFPLKMLNVNNYYDMLMSMWRTETYFNLEPKEVEYYPKGTILTIDSGVDFSEKDESIPWLFRKLDVPSHLSSRQRLIRSILQGTKSYDGVMIEEYEFKDFYSLSVSINRRNKDAWYKMRQAQYK
jgi:hypothetical protein